MVIYRPIVGWPDSYRVGDDGTVWTRRKTGRFGGLTDTWHRLTINYQGGIWPRVALTRPRAHKSRWVSLPVIVCRAFNGPRPLGCRPLHFPDPDPRNCRAENLRWAPRGTRQLGRDPRPGGRPELVGKPGRNAQLSDQEVMELRREYAAGRTQEELAAALGVARHVVRLAVLGRTYKHLPGGVTRERVPCHGLEHPLAKLDDNAVRDIRTRAAAGEPAKSLALLYGVSRGSIYQIIQRRTWKHVE
jgi:HNH endonuclease